MKSKDYWKKRYEALEKVTHHDTEQINRELEKSFIQAQRTLESQINNWYDRLAENNHISSAEARKLLNSEELKEFKWSVEDYIKYGKENAIDQRWAKELENVSAKVHISRLESLKVQTQQTVEALFGNYVDTADKAIRAAYTDRYYRSLFEAQKGFNIGFKVGRIDENRLTKIMAKPWLADGKNFSSRIWDNRSKLVNELHNELTQMIALGRPPDKSITNIEKKFNVSRSHAGALLMTESSYFANEAQLDTYGELGVEKVEVDETLDSVTCDFCGSMDGQIIDLKDCRPGITIPPYHPRCRGTTVPYFDDDIGEKFARDQDGKTYYVPSNINYQEWRDTYCVDPKLAEQLYDLKAQQNKIDLKTYSHIWKDDVSTQDWKYKKGSVDAKKDYFKTKLQEDLSKEEKSKFTKLLKDLNEFDRNGKKYYDLEAQITKVERDLTQLRTGSIIKEDKYSQARKDAAYWFDSEKDADAVLRDVAGELWQTLSTDERRAAYEYTSGSGKYNRPLRGYDNSWYDYKGIGKVPLNNEGAEKYIKSLAETIDKSEYDFDLWLQRGIENSKGAASFLKVDAGWLTKATQKELEEALLDKIVMDPAFVSTGAAKGSGFGGYTFNIYAPQGTKMLYAEPFSAYGRGDRLAWDGIKKQSYFSSEFEVIIQKGYAYKVVKVEKKGSTIYFDLEVRKE